MLTVNKMRFRVSMCGHREIISKRALYLYIVLSIVSRDPYIQYYSGHGRPVVKNPAKRER